MMSDIRLRLLNGISRKYHLARLAQRFKRPLSFSELRALRANRNELYFHWVHRFDHSLPNEVREHRRYFSVEGRGFGEDAFHAMWFLLFKEFRPASALEIGVYRGQTITLWKLLSRILAFPCQVAAVSPFSPAGDSVSRYQDQLDYFDDMVRNHQHFNLELPDFCRHYSTAPEARSFIQSRRWDLIYIDGNHDYEVALQDWLICSQALALGGIMVLDDSALNTDFRPPGFATAGHPGPSRLAGEVGASPFQEIFSAGHNRVFQRTA